MQAVILPAIALVFAMRYCRAIRDGTEPSPRERARATRARVRDLYQWHSKPGDGLPDLSEYPPQRLVRQFKFPDDPVVLAALQTQIEVYCRLAEAGLAGKCRSDLNDELHQAAARGDEGDSYQL